MGAIAAGTHDVDDVRAVYWEGYDPFHKGVEHSAELCAALTLGTQGDQESSELGGIGRVVHDLSHGPSGVVRIEVVPPQKRCEQAWPGADGLGH
ncbi:hypothetical protein GCM10023193_06870 [Planotetraspora kaengkrachanensis]|uniref:Uncharacterized protein n=1 Tax=Planotetraspora kaengkrachanensis TaxID=575193 RepID=A0A8J3VA16_9ACTN|nr:hypothetical protein Pka01_61480 [Planotetraspora kaengkrachanensis]